MAHTLSLDSTMAEVMAHPVGHDAMSTIVGQLRLPRWLVFNPLVGRVKLSWLQALEPRLVPVGLIDTVLEGVNTTTDRPTPATDAPPLWWQSAVIYQIYPRSFADSNGDGLGDLRGIIQRLDYLAGLGVDCLWLSPIFASPNEDNGYDVSDYRAVMAEMGTLADVDALIAGCHERGMRIILDLVVNHTSDQHEWFQAAREDPEGPYGDYYFLRPGSPETPPNNWRSYFYSPAWRWLDDTRRWVLRLFSPGQPDLNWDNPRVRQEVALIVQWWLDRGVDGFRLDVINFISKAEGLPDGNEFIGELLWFRGLEHYFHGPHLHEYLTELRRDGFTRDDQARQGPGQDSHALMVGETPGVGIELGRLLSGRNREELDLVLSFEHLENPGKTRWDDYRYDLSHLIDYYRRAHSAHEQGDWLSLFFENHDNPRMISKVNPDPRWRTHLGKALAMILLTMRGTPFLYQGQEIGAINQNFTDPSQLRDIESLNRVAQLREAGADGFNAVRSGTRDHARTPMRWDARPKHGFTDGQPWIGFHEDSHGFTVAEQSDDPDSVLNFYRRLIELRRANPALTLGDITFLQPRRRDYAGWIRCLDSQRWLVEINLSPAPIRRPPGPQQAAIRLGTTAHRGPWMAPYEATLSLLPS